ncbi:hypothetical protein [Haloferax sulfurifontis]|uniref:Uncharacterized protein n=1 Tax=Haloferax sulfurifontis ATCC BAA-897 TaxID=662480 RepID=M0I9E9_9EURY|nr:hypothetical protein [Haloferax sulfurifontis]ELZ92647.1 hypothetical protein C441_10523 [Haloferax sulfurifontis ATCC BAA-897]
MTLGTSEPTGREYVRHHKDDLVKILRHGSNPEIRAYAYAILLRYGTERDIEEIRREFETVIGGER